MAAIAPAVPAEVAAPPRSSHDDVCAGRARVGKSCPRDRGDETHDPRSRARVRQRAARMASISLRLGMVERPATSSLRAMA